MTLIDRERTEYLSARDSSPQELLTHAAKRSGRGVLDINREFRALSKAPNCLNLVEYVRNGLFHNDRFSPEERAQFISNDRHWEITYQCSKRSWAGASEDKIVAATLMASGGVPVPETVAVIDRSPRLYPGAAKVETADQLRAVLNEHSGDTLFCKTLDGMISFGSFRIVGFEDDRVLRFGHAPVTTEEFLSDVVGDTPYIVQKALQNHPDIATYASALATVRMVNLVSDSGVACPVALIKLPQGDNVADAFWRPGNLACDIDPDTGRIRTVARRGIETEFLADHPETAGLMGLELPFWSELREINERAARIFAPIRYQSTDIAITASGPVVVELNYGGGFDLPQYASGRGLLTPEVRAFFESCGVNLDDPIKRKWSLFGKRAAS